MSQDDLCIFLEAGVFIRTTQEFIAELAEESGFGGGKHAERFKIQLRWTFSIVVNGKSFPIRGRVTNVPVQVSRLLGAVFDPQACRKS